MKTDKKRNYEIDLDDIGEGDIAVVGMAARVPGAKNYREFWRNLCDGVESIRRYSEEELLTAGESLSAIRARNYVPAGAPLDDMEMFDGEFFGFSPKESAIIDPQHRHFYEVAWEALEDAGHPPEKFTGPIGVFAGSGMGGYFYFNICTNPGLLAETGLFLLRHTGNDKDFLSTRVSHLMNLTGPSINVQTACSTSLVAIHLACQSLISGECDMAIAGGSTIELPHRRGYHFRENEILSPDGHCHAFDHRAEGTVFGSGSACVVLRPLRAAVENGDPIHAVIRGSAVNNDGARKAGYLAPSVDGQAAAVTEALAVAGVDADDIGYIETHGTGTYLGDPIEVAALTTAFRQSTDRRGFCRIGSVKSNIGHTDTAAGVIGFIKAVLSVEHGQMVPSLHFEKPNPTIDFEGSPFQVNAQLTPWSDADGPRRAGVNSLGVGGTNAHAIVEQPPRRVDSSPVSGPQLLVVSARNKGGLDGNCDRLAEFLERSPSINLADAAYTLKEGRRTFDKRRVLVADDREEAISLLRSRERDRVFDHASLGDSPDLIFMFPGGGAQYPNMARGLYDNEPTFRKVIDAGLLWLQGKTIVDLRSVLFPAPEKIGWAQAEFKRPSVQLPAIYLVEFALGKLLMDKGFAPSGFVGHSLGENTSAALSGVFTFEEGLGLVLLRGQLFDTVPPGGMLSIPLGEAELMPLLGDELDLACINGPGLTVASGPNHALAALTERLAARDIEAQRIQIDIAAHSRMLVDLLKPFGDYLRKLKLRAPEIRFLSNRSGTWITDSEATDPEYWVGHLRNTVRFADCVATLASNRSMILLEVGPGRTLGSLAKQNPGINPQSVLSSLRHPDQKIDDLTQWKTVLGRLWALGMNLPAETLWPGEHRQRVRLPTYAFAHQRYFIEPGKGAEPVSDVPNLSRQPAFDDWFYRPAWRRLDQVAGVDAPADVSPARWLLFVDEKGLGQDLAKRLRERGDIVVTVEPGDAYYKVDGSSYRLSPEHGRDGYEALLRDLLESGEPPDRIVHLWLLAEEESFRAGSTFFHRNQERGFYSLLFLAQAMVSESYPRPTALTVVSQGMHSTNGEPVAYPEQSTVLGPCKVIPRELPGVTCVSLDLESPEPTANRDENSMLAFARKVPGVAALSARFGLNPESMAPLNNAVMLDAVENELRLTPGNRQVALRQGARWQFRYERAQLPADKPGVTIRDGGVYLLTGGFGGIGLSLARMLAREHKAKLVLVGRSPLPEPREWERWAIDRPNDPASVRIRAIRELEGLGAEVYAADGDVADAVRMAEIIAETRRRWGGISGVIHAAGALSDGLIPVKQQSQVENVFTAKVHGTLVLERALEVENGETPLDFFVVFSSTSVAIASAGQVDYVAANAFLEAFVDSRRALGKPMQALSWGVWSQVGMAAKAARKLGLDGDAQNTRSVERGYPLFESRRPYAGGGWILQGTLDAKTQWVLDQHRTAAGEAVLPGTGYIELFRAAISEIEAGAAFELRDLFFFRPLAVSDDEPRAFRVRAVASEEGYDLSIQSRQKLTDGSFGWALHAQGRALVLRHTEPSILDLAAIDGRCNQLRLGDDPSGLRLEQEDHLRFGPRWRVLHRSHVGNGEALARLVLPESFVSDLDAFALHPALLDMATGFALGHLQSSAGPTTAALWVPLSYRRLRLYAPLQREIWSWVQTSSRRTGRDRKSDSGFASFDVTLTDAAGKVLCEIEEFTMRRLDDASALGIGSVSDGRDLEREDGSRGRVLSSAEIAFQKTLEEGVTPAEGVKGFLRVIRNAAQGRILCSSIDLQALIRQAEVVKEAEAGPETRFARPDLDSEYVAPRSGVEKTLVGFWQELLGVEQVGIKDSFFDLGGHSLIAVRLFARIKKAFNVDYPISVLFEAPTIEACAALIGEIGNDEGATVGDVTVERTRETPKPRYTHLVPMHDDGARSKGRTPFFLVAGMFGNVLNLRHLAQLVSAERPFYGLQARGLYGDQAPHENFQEMARDYLVELRQVQPHGPYLLGGFSGGGIAAYEMARQLRADGEQVAIVVMLDTPLPNDEPIGIREKLVIQSQILRKKGPRYVFDWIESKRNYRKQQVEKAAVLATQKGQGASHDFHSTVIEAAFYRACAQYSVIATPIQLALFRPRLRPAHQLAPGRAINQDRRRIYFDNGWSPHVTGVDVFEVPGDHDGMVLEPNVRVLAVKLRDALDSADARAARIAELARGSA